MTRRKIFIAFLAVLFFLPFGSAFAQSPGAGFIESSIWYSKDPFFEGDKVKIFTAIFNPDQRELSGTVRFFDGEVLLGKKDFKVPGNGVREVSIDWTVSAGAHNIFAKIENAKFLVSAGKYENASILETESEESKRTVSKKIIVKEDDESGEANGPTIESIERFIAEGTPDIIKKPVVGTATAIESFRSSAGESVKKEKEEVKIELSATAPEGEEAESQSRLKRPLQNLKLFFLSILSIILNSKAIFYGLSAVILFLALKYLWRLVF